MLENEFRTMIQGAVAKLGGHLSWIESHATSAGFPDADICINGVIVQAELKIEKKDGSIEIRPTQYRWFKDRTAVGGLPVLLVGTDDGLWLVPGYVVNDAPERKGNTRLHSMDQIRGNPRCIEFTSPERLIEMCVAWCDPT